jgi:cytochrome c peroxidase
MTYGRLALPLVLGALLSACGSDSSAPVSEIPAADLDAQLSVATAERELRLDASGLPSATSPLARLGRTLFFSRTLSGDKDVACVSCHHPLLAGADGLSLSVGVKPIDPAVLGPSRLLQPNTDGVAKDGPNVPRNAPTTFNIAFYSRAMFHDGRMFVLDGAHAANGQGQLIRSPDSIGLNQDPAAVPNLTAAQARFPITSQFEMRGFGELANMDNEATRDALGQRLHDDPAWLAPFRAGFQQPSASADDLINYANIALALGEYQRSQVFIDNPWQRYLRGQPQALNESAKRGALLFFRSREQGGLGCVACHDGAHFTNEKFYVSGFPQIGRGKNTDQEDFGRHAITRDETDRFRFRVPSLLNVSATAPYGHAGTFDTLEEVVRYHVDPQYGASRFDPTLQHLKQFQGLSVRYPNALKNTLDAAAAFMASDSKELLYKPNLTDEHLGYLVSFLQSLKDPCLDNEACLSPWIAEPATDNPDGNMLEVCFHSAVVPGHMCPGGDPVPPPTPPPPLPPGIPAAADPAVVRDPAKALATVAALNACSNGVGVVANTNQLVFAAQGAAQSGLAHKHEFTVETWTGHSGSRAMDFLVSGALAVGDIDQNCWPDLLFPAGDQGNYLYSGNGDGSFTRLTPASLFSEKMAGAAIADLNGDYQPELVLSGFSNPTGGVTDIKIYKGPVSSPELVADTAIAVHRNGLSLTVGDYDRDGWPDLFFGLWTAAINVKPDNHLWKNLGNISFHPADAPLGLSGMTNSVDWTFAPNLADINNDGRADILMAADFENSQVYLQNPDGTFLKVTNRDVISDENGMGAAVADFDNDGDLDWFVSAIYGDMPPNFTSGVSGNRFYRNTGNGVFVDDTDAAGVRDGSWGWGSCAADFDNDGDLDIYHVNGFDFPTDVWEEFNYFGIRDRARIADAAKLFINDGAGHFTEQAAAWSAADAGEGRGVSCLDSDRDGDVDLLIANNSGLPSYYLNQAGTGAGRRFLSVRLVGQAPNTESLGARIYVTAGGKTQMREVSQGSNYASNNPLEQHFGLAGAAVAEQVRVVWPASGKEVVLTNQAANQFLVIGEPE